ncbi:SGNH/GDSL hydrolase family protein [Alloscardovia criceti]|uniref:SGNH/GDSL hydrolase family protein n=1 Tax=Alloscardovia criceti TaxID=356828 RepID=UPI00037DF3C8|nr:SGNH/GDSL hydrolase family protein [Alloscardovia criceti]
MAHSIAHIQLEPHSRIVFVGDSVTDAGRDYTAMPGGWGFGTGYVNHIHNLLSAVYPDHAYMTINSGFSGDDIDAMADRWDTDVLALQPDYVSIMIGINDVWRHFDGEFRQAPTHDVAYFSQVYDTLIEKTRQQLPELKGIYVLSPVMFERSFDDPMRALLADFQEACQQVAQRQHCVFIDMQAAINRCLESQHSCLFSADRVHPNERGAMILAHAWLTSVGFDWKREDYDN